MSLRSVQMRFLAVAAVMVAMLLLCPCLGRAAAQWEWTKDQGWSEGSGSARKSAREQLRRALALEQKGEYYDAAKQYFLCIRVFPDSGEAGIAMQRLAKCLFMMENYYQSYKAIEQVIASYPQSGRMADLVQIEYNIGRMLKKGARISLLDGDDEEARAQSRRAAIQVFESVLGHDAYGPLADDALVSLGDTHLLLNEPTKARERYERLLKEFSKSPLVDRARLGITRAKVLEGKAQSTEVQSMIDQMKTRQRRRNAVPDLGYTADDDSIDDAVKELEELEAGKMWEAAQFYERRGTTKSRKAALFTYEEIARRYPTTSFAKQARDRMGVVEVPSERSRFMPTWPKIRLPNPFRRDKANKPAFVTPQLGEEEVNTGVVLEPVPGVQGTREGHSAAGVNPSTESGKLALAAPGSVPAPQATPVPRREGAAAEEFGPGPDLDQEEPGPGPSAAGIVPMAKRGRHVRKRSPGDRVQVPGTDPQGVGKAMRHVQEEGAPLTEGASAASPGAAATSTGKGWTFDLNEDAGPVLPPLPAGSGEESPLPDLGGTPPPEATPAPLPRSGPAPTQESSALLVPRARRKSPRRASPATGKAAEGASEGVVGKRAGAGWDLADEIQ